MGLKNLLRRAVLLLILFTAISCEGFLSGSAEAPVDQLKLSLPKRVALSEGMTLTINFTPGYGPLQTDWVSLRSTDQIDTFLPVQQVENSSFSIKLPSDLCLGAYTFHVRRKGVIKNYGTIAFIAPGAADVVPQAGATVYGQVSCGTKPLAGVVVSDGYEVVSTDKDGIYQLRSEKAAGYVFISIPSGYHVKTNGVVPRNFQYTRNPAGTVERMDFALSPAGDQTNHTMLYFGDIHLANRTNDRSQFKFFTDDVLSYIKAHPDEKIYAMTLGDMTWDVFWYDRSYCFPEYLKDMSPLTGLQVFHTVGNHDHDMKAVGDIQTIARFRKDVSPNYYSFNIGQIHYVVLDNIQCTNNGNGDRTFNSRVVADVLNWLKKDLSYVDKSTPVFVTMHSPLHNYRAEATLRDSGTLLAAFSGYNVTFITGHTHVVYNVDKTSVVEHNSGAVCAAWWWAGKYNQAFNIGTDGAPSGYRIGTVRGKIFTSTYKATGRSEDYQFRAYDRNSIQITASRYGVPSSRAAALNDIIKGDYALASSTNEILVNVWDYDPRWKVEILEEGNPLSVTRLDAAYDPAFLIAYTVPRLKESDSASWEQNVTGHIFSAHAAGAKSTVTIRVTDDEGRTYTSTMPRPFAFQVSNYL